MRHRLTHIFMHRVYKRLANNMEHLVASALRYVPEMGMAEQTFKQIIYLAIVLIKKKIIAESTPVLATARRENGYLLVDHTKI